MSQIALSPLSKKITAEISIPGCIGYTIRALNIAAMTKGSVKIQNPLKSDDIYSMVNALKVLGIAVEEGENYFIVYGDIGQVANKDYKIDIGLSGRAARTLLALLCIVPGEKILTCAEEFKKRPIGDLVEGLRQIGAKIEYLEKDGHLPLKILSSVLNQGSISIRGEMSSQYFSAIMMIAPLIGNITIDVEGSQSSKPYVDMTINIMKDFGVNVINDNYAQYKIQNGQDYKNPNLYSVEPEATGASYFFSIAAVTRSKIKIPGLGPESLQGDIRMVDILEKMGCIVSKNQEAKWIEVEGTNALNGITVDMNDTPDLVPTLSVVAAFADGMTKMTNIAHVRLKETDRIDSPKNELLKMGITAVATNDSLTITGGDPKPAMIETYGDHRMAMSFAIAGTKIDGIKINNPDVVNKSFPEFWDKLEDIGIGIERIN